LLCDECAWNQTLWKFVEFAIAVAVVITDVLNDTGINELDEFTSVAKPMNG
jgi:hypothetical protein